MLIVNIVTALTGILLISVLGNAIVSQLWRRRVKRAMQAYLDEQNSSLTLRQYRRERQRQFPLSRAQSVAAFCMLLVVFGWGGIVQAILDADFFAFINWMVLIFIAEFGLTISMWSARKYLTQQIQLKNQTATVPDFVMSPKLRRQRFRCRVWSLINFGLVLVFLVGLYAAIIMLGY